MFYNSATFLLGKRFTADNMNCCLEMMVSLFVVAMLYEWKGTRLLKRAIGAMLSLGAAFFVLTLVLSRFIGGYFYRIHCLLGPGHGLFPCPVPLPGGLPQGRSAGSHGRGNSGHHHCLASTGTALRPLFPGMGIRLQQRVSFHSHGGGAIAQWGSEKSALAWCSARLNIEN